MRNITNAMILGVVLLAAPPARAGDDDHGSGASDRAAVGWTDPSVFASDPYDDSGVSARTPDARRASHTGRVALAPDPYDDSGMSARAFESSSGSPSAAVALASDPYDDSGMSARAFVPSAGSIVGSAALAADATRGSDTSAGARQVGARATGNPGGAPRDNARLQDCTCMR